MNQTRYALYFVPPPESALAAFGREWLGYDTETGQALAPNALGGIAPDFLVDITQEARRYGFHATLKPPFALADGASEADLIGAIERFAAATPPAQGPRLTLAAIGGFLALIPAGQSEGLMRLAAACVRGLDLFRRPASPEETARRRAAGLNPRQEALLERWGYPYVLDEFHFHMTLTRRLAPDERARIEPVLATLLGDRLATPLSLADIALCREMNAGGFSVRARFPLGIS